MTNVCQQPGGRAAGDAGGGAPASLLGRDENELGPRGSGSPGEQLMLGAQRKTTVCVGETSRSHIHRQIQGWGLCLEGELEPQPGP